MDEFTSLEKSLEGFFGLQLRKLTKELRARIKRDFTLVSWDRLGSDQRRIFARQWDSLHDPALEVEHQAWWELYQRKAAIKNEIFEWSRAATPTANKKALQESRLKELREELANIEMRERRAHTASFAARTEKQEGATESSPDEQQYLPYPKALRLLAQTHGATPEELAAWVFYGPANGGLAAFVNANELNPPPRFRYEAEACEGTDYLAPLMACWFRADDIAGFVPADRYITGQALRERWSGVPGERAEAYIRAKISESRLLDMHPITGATQWTEDATWPAKESALFSLTYILVIEAEDGLNVAFERNDPTSGLDVTRGRARATGETPDERVIRLKQLDLADLEQWRVSIDASPASVAQTLGVLLLPAEAGARPSRQSNRNAAIQTKYAELAALGRRNFVKEIKRTVIGADSLSDRRIRDIAKGR